MKITASVTKSSHQDRGPCYLHLPIFFLIHTLSCLLQDKKFLCRPSQIACTVTTINVTRTRKSVHGINSSMLKLFDFANFSVFLLPYAWMILSFITSCEGYKLWKLLTVNWCYQPVTTENYFSPAHTDHYDLRK